MRNAIPGLPKAMLFVVVLCCFLSVLGRPLQAAHMVNVWQVGVAQGTALPDLIIEKIVVTPPNPGAGSVGDIEVTVKNIGEAAVTDFTVHLYVDPTENPPTLATVETTRSFYGLDPLLPGTTWSFARTGHTFTQANPKIYAWVDRNNQVAELNENNNLFPTPRPQGIDAYEQDDICNEAKSVVVNAEPKEPHTLFREAEQPDADWVKFEAKAGIVYVVSAVSLGVDANLLIESHNRCDGPPSLGAGQTVTITALSNNTYYLKIEHRSTTYGPDNAYQLLIRSDERCARFEPNNLCAVASELYAGGDAISGTFCVADDHDWYRFEVKAGGRYTVTANNVGSKANVQMQLYESCETNAVRSGLQLPYTASQKGYVYIRTQNQDPKIAGLDTKYTLLVQADNSGRCEEDRFEQSATQDDTRADAQPINQDDTPQIHNICPAGDVDWVKFTASAGVTYTLETFDLASDADTKLCLYDVAGKEIVCDDDSGAGAGSRLTLANAQAGDYYLSVKDVNVTVAGGRTQYSLQVNRQECQKDEQEPDDLQATAKLLKSDNRLQTHTICGKGDVDWVKFEAQVNTPYIIETSEVGPDADTIVELYTAAGVRLGSNDDYTDSIASLLNYTITTAGEYYVKVRLYNPTRYGKGTNYGLRIRTGTFTGGLPPTTEASGETQAQPPPSGILTLILVNQTRLTQLYGASTVQGLMTKLDMLARHEKVRGEIVKLDEIEEIQEAYSSWVADSKSVGKANQTADAIRRMIQRYREQHGGLQYLILVGDDRALPFFRIPDGTDQTPERSYTDVNDAHPTGAALNQNYYLSDDYYATQEPVISPNGVALYIPDLAAGRLIETPADMSQLIDRFIANPMPIIDRVLVTGWTFVSDVATENCTRWRKILGDNSQTKVNCEMIGDGWLQQQFRAARLQTNPVYQVQSINGHAAHFGDQAPDHAVLAASQIEGTVIDFGGGLIYSPGCHAGLNVPPENVDPGGNTTLTPLDLPEVFIRKGANYVGNTGFGYGSEAGVVLSEQLVQLYTEELGKTSFGKALMKAKQRYKQQLAIEPTGYEQKVVQQLVYFGLPMFHELPLNLGGEDDPFAGVDFDLSPPSLGPGDTVTVRTANINFQNGNLQTVTTEDGAYLTLSDQAQAAPGQPVLPLYYKDLGQPNRAVRSVIIRSAAYSLTVGVDPVTLTPYNEYVASSTELPVDSDGGWYPSVPLRVQTLSDNATLATQVAQYHPATGQLRQFTNMQVSLLASNSSDYIPPTVTIIDGLYNQLTGQVTVKVGAADSTGIQSVTLNYIKDEQTKTGMIESIQLQFDPGAYKWVGSFAGDGRVRFFAQVVDRSGNLTKADNKGHWFAPSLEVRGPNGEQRVFLPIISR